MYNKLIISVLCAFLAAFFIDVKGQKIYFFNENGELKQVDNSILTPSEHLSLVWNNDDDFIGPWDVCCVTDNNEHITAEHIVDVAACTIELPNEGHFKVSILSANGKQKNIIVEFSEPNNWLWWIGITLLSAAIIANIVYQIRRKLEFEQLEAEKQELRKTKKYDSATVLFSDIQGFTKISEHMNPEQLVDELDKYFIYFDELVERYDVEKIKTIGDAYMCAGGVPEFDSANPIEVTLVGLGMIDYVKERQMKGAFWNMRVGIHTGPLVSAVLGNKKKAFDIWGDSVNTASRMESSGVPGEVNISGDTYIKIADYFECQYRGKMPVKYKGEIDMYFVKGLKPEFADGGSKCRPNKALITRIQAMKVDDVLYNFQLQLKESLDEAYAQRFETLMMQCEMLSYAESLSVKETMFVKLAMLHLFAQDECPKAFRLNTNNLMKRLSKAHFDDTDINELIKILNRPNILKTPEGVIEEIIYDSYYMTYCRKDLVKQLQNMQVCAADSGHRFKKKDWIETQQHTINNIEFRTQSARELVEVPLIVQKGEFEQIIRQV